MPEKPSLAAFLDGLAARGLALRVDGDTLILSGPKVVRNEFILSYLRRHKAALVKVVKAAAEESPLPFDFVAADEELALDDLPDSEYHALIRVAYRAARDGSMPGEMIGKDRVPVSFVLRIPGDPNGEALSSPNPAQLLLDLLAEGRRMRASVGMCWYHHTHGAAICANIDEIALWWRRYEPLEHRE